MPKYGFRVGIPIKYDNITWYGRGEWESYPDRKTGAFIGLYRKTLDCFGPDYVMAQDNSNRTDVRWFSLTDASGQGLRFTSATPFNFRAWPYDEDDIDIILKIVRSSHGRQINIKRYAHATIGHTYVAACHMA